MSAAWSNDPQRERRRLAAAVAAIVVCTAGGIAYRVCAAEWGAGRPASMQPLRPLASLPIELGGWRGQDAEVPEALIRAARLDAHLCRDYREPAGGRMVRLYLAFTARPGDMLGHRPEVCYPGAGWAQAGRAAASIRSESRVLPVVLHRFEKIGASAAQQVVLNFYVLAGQVTADEHSFAGLAWRDPNVRGDVERYVAQVQVIAPVAFDYEVAERTALDFAAGAAGAVLELLPGARSENR